MLSPKVSSDGHLPQPGASGPSRVAAVGPYIQSSTMPRIASRPELLVKPALPDGPGATQASEGSMKVQTLPNMRSGAASQLKGKTRHFQVLSGLSCSRAHYDFPPSLSYLFICLFLYTFLLFVLHSKSFFFLSRFFFSASLSLKGCLPIPCSCGNSKNLLVFFGVEK